MDWKNLAVAILTPLVAFGVKALLSLIGFELDDATFNAFVGAIVAYLVALVFQGLGAAGVRKIKSLM